MIPRFLACALLTIPVACIFSSEGYAGDLAAKKTDGAIKIDGVLNESGWSAAPSISGFVQFEPHYGTPSAYKTVVKVLYDKGRIYFGILCSDPEPGKISSKVTRRDGTVSDDDAVAVILDHT